MERRPKKPIPEITRGQYFGGDEQDSDDTFQDDLFEDNFDMAMDYLAVISRVTLRIVEWSADQPGQAPDG